MEKTWIPTTRQTTTMAILAALYVSIGLAIPFISFGVIQCRISDALYPLISVFGLPSVVALTLGQFIYNFYGYTIGVALGPLDLLSPLMFLPAKIAIWKWGLKAVPLHVMSVALWVPFLLNQMFNIPMIATIPTVGIGELIAEIVVGIPLTLALRRRMNL